MEQTYKVQITTTDKKVIVKEYKALNELEAMDIAIRSLEVFQPEIFKDILDVKVVE